MITSRPHRYDQLVSAWATIPRPLQYLIESLAIFLVYNVLGDLNREFTPPPTGISPIWLPAGFAVGVMLVRGWWTAVPLFLTGFINTIRADLSLTDPVAHGGFALPMTTLLWAAALFGLSVAGHSLVARALVGSINTTRYDGVRSAFLFLAFVGPVSSIVSALLGTEVFRVEGFVTGDTFAVSAFTFWIGDSIASILIAPVFIALFGGPAWRSRRPGIIVLAIAATLIVVASTTLVGRTELERIRQTFERSTTRAVAVFEARVRRIENVALDQATLLGTAPHLTGKQFDASTRDKIKRSSGIDLIASIETPNGDIQRARAISASGVGTDDFRQSFIVDPIRTQLIRARDTGRAIWVPQTDDPGAVADLAYAPVYENAVDASSLDPRERRLGLTGFVAVRTDLQAALEASTDSIVDASASSVVRSEQSGQVAVVLASLPQQDLNPLIDPDLTPLAAARTKGVPFASSRTFDLGSAPWSVTFAPSRAFVTDRAFLVTVLPASMIALVMSLTIMLVALMSTGQRARLTMLVRARTRDLAESEHRYRSVVDNVHEAIFQLDDRDRISFVSAGWHDDLSIGGRSGALGASLTEVIRLADTATLRELLDQARQAPGSTVHHEFESIDRSSIYEIRLTAHPTDGASDAEPGDPAMAASIFGIIVDMTTQREGLRNRERFVSLVAHELRNPLTVISGSVATIADHEQDLLPPLTAKLLPAVQSSAHRLDRIISDLLVSSQIDAGTLSLVAASTDLVALVRASITAAEPTAVEHGVQLTDDLPDDGLQVMCDPDRVAQVVDNLLSNAIKYTPGGGTIHAAMQVDERADVVRVIVRDSGIGIARDDRARVFERFGRTEQGTIAAPGTGLGLSICLAIAEAHDGSIELLSELGVGSTFSLVLPLH